MIGASVTQSFKKKTAPSLRRSRVCSPVVLFIIFIVCPLPHIFTKPLRFGGRGVGGVLRCRITRSSRFLGSHLIIHRASSEKARAKDEGAHVPINPVCGKVLCAKVNNTPSQTNVRIHSLGRLQFRLSKYARQSQVCVCATRVRVSIIRTPSAQREAVCVLIF